MSLSFDSYFGAHAKALIGRDHRASQLAHNIANANTPNYKAQDIDFKEYLTTQLASQAQQLQATSPGHIRTGGDFSSNLKYRNTSQTALDGNTVDKDLEVMEYTKNSLNYQASLNFLNNKIKNMMLVLRGE